MRRPILPLLAALGAGLLAILAPSCSCNSSPGTTCQRTTCLTAGANCGQIDDGCGGKLDCGYCGGGMTCGGGGVDNVCGGTGSACTPITCSDARASCGTVPDGCGGEVHCGYCGAGETCGGGGSAWQCGMSTCTPITCAAAGANCGKLPDGCGGSIDCGTCPGGQTCGGDGTANQCGSGNCIPTGQCGSNDCGFVSDGCGAALDCGGCAGNQICHLGATCVAASPGSVGGSCAQGSDCVGGVCLTGANDGWPGGYCSAWCNTDGDCGTGNVCADKNGAGRGICVAGCTSNTDCGNRSGYACNDLGFGQRGCTPSGTGGGAVGSPCTSVADCQGGSGAICAPIGGGTAGGYCTVACGTAGTACPTGSHCSFGTAGAVCEKDCTSSADCASGFTCTDWDGDGTPECVPAAPTGAPCSQDSDCAGGTCLTQGQTGWTGGYCTATCTTDADCGNGSQCVISSSGVHQCLKSCQSTRDCRNGYACVDSTGTSTGVCQSYGGGPGAVGDPCTSVNDCSGGQVAVCETDAGGYPSGFCSIQCTSNDQCPSGSTCITPTGSASGLCKNTCTGDGDCRPSYTCQKDAQGDSVCSPGGQTTTGGAPTGSACTGSKQCAGLACYDQLHTGWPGGYCYAACRSDADCATGSHCGNIQTAGGVSGGTCYQNCSSNSDCRTGYACLDTDGDGRKECVPYGGGSGTIGSPCTTINQCADGGDALCNLNLDGFPGGYCSAVCSNSKACPGTNHCTKTQGDQVGMCLQAPCCTSMVTCTYDQTNKVYTCPTGMHCVTGALGGVEHYCAYDSETCDGTHACPDGHECSGSTGDCMACASGATTCRNDYDCFDLDQNSDLECWPAAKGTGAVGAPCTQLRDCSGGVHGLCLLEDKGYFLGGMCVWNCEDGTACPGGSACVNLTPNAPAGTQPVEYCLPTCSSSNPCRQGYSCSQWSTNGPNVCFIN